jgi:hypothetical protein
MSHGNALLMVGGDPLRQTAHVFMGCVRAEQTWRTSEESPDTILLEHVQTARRLAFQLAAELAFGESPDFER